MASKITKGRKRIEPWTKCAICAYLAFDPKAGACHRCDREKRQEAAIDQADAWLEGMPHAWAEVAADRDKLVDAIQQAFEDAEQRVFLAAQRFGYMK